MSSVISRETELERKSVSVGDLMLDARLMIGAIALVTTAFWAGVIQLVCWVVGLVLPEIWLAAVSAVIFLVLLLGLSLPAIASRYRDGPNSDRTQE